MNLLNTVLSKLHRIPYNVLMISRKVIQESHEVLQSLNESGLRATSDLIINKKLRFYLRRYFDRKFDRKFHVDTSGKIQLADLDIDSENKKLGVYYEPTPVKILRSIFSNLPSDLIDFIFIDFGSGKGRTLLVASDYNFKKIIGVDFSKELHLVAQNNIRVYRSKKQRCFDIESVCTDAITFPIPIEKTVFYFYHPFEKEIMVQVLNNIKKSYLDHPRKIYIIIYYPVLSYLIDDLAFMRKVETKSLFFDIWNLGLAVYESHP